MRIFKSTNTPKQSDEKFIGLYMDEEAVAKLTLISLGEGVNKSSLFKTILLKWMSNKDPILAVADRAFHSWLSKGKDYRIALGEFKQNLRRELFVKKIPRSMVDDIMKKFEDLV